VLHDVFSLDTTPRRHLTSTALRALRRSGVRTRDLVRDGWAGVRAL
jgi:electron transfer flavoprotein-quinone oxidoreductase